MSPVVKHLFTIRNVYPFIANTIKYYHFMKSSGTATHLAVQCYWNITSFHSYYKHYFWINLDSKIFWKAIWETSITFSEFWMTITMKQYFESINALKSNVLHIFYFLKTKINHHIHNQVNFLCVVLVPCVIYINQNIFSSVLLGKLNQGLE